MTKTQDHYMRTEVPRKYWPLYKRVSTSRKASIRFYCLQCVGFKEREVILCTDLNCAHRKWRLGG